uniref:Hsp90 chaperone protein kinase-targeting subunit n=1 Tax=Noctiluca scintillans TaxID=2966 RepID=A0A7S1ALX1_NOCSC|mmetsp:Transcript_50846/g.135738  ORF Transcript_50846/g.135738 Transcript_50846/m.135738 type:complete len:328 (+) Transcript_50846:61-1044(+)|eukprot:CAMPEP_0194501796 /NCGR_PEP_ID=MMETSP0253-20130528/23146_1 /TAXON_ID=2966 /ORGANISM="Noctiluca scintillans" /LENGTH=327 /DNA_ID=CAMNT_0039343831 /DNA_START=61 /DNA_END=1044 /DNA_ORIENTATION=-
MSKLSFDYSRFDRIEDSDDEDKHHPNLDKGLNQRVIRITRDRKEEEIDTEKKKLEEAGKSEEAEKLEKKRPLHINNMCQVAEERTIINSASGRRDRLVKDSESFSVNEYQEFKIDHESLLEKFTHANWEQSHDLLAKHGDILLDDNANNYFLLTTLDEEMAGNKERVQKLSTQGQIISQIHQLAKPMNRPPRDLVHRFFERFESDQAQAAFQEGVDHFLGHIQKRAVQKKAEMEEEAEKEALINEAKEHGEPVPLIEAMHEMKREDRLGPGGLDPVEVFAALPEELQNCFKSGDVEMLKTVATNMDPEVFQKHWDAILGSGLWQQSG